MLQRQTTDPELFTILEKLMGIPLLYSFRLVGGTALSLLKGHRISVDIDLFTDQEYGTTDFKLIEQVLKANFPIVENPNDAFPALKALEINEGLKLNIGYDANHLIKTDILYWDAPFIFDQIEKEGIRLASTEEIGAMKLDVVSRGGRKKDFWDLVEIFEDYSLNHLLQIYKIKYPYHESEDVIRGLTDFTIAEEVPDPICLKGRTWTMVKQRIAEEAKKL